MMIDDLTLYNIGRRTLIVVLAIIIVCFYIFYGDQPLAVSFTPYTLSILLFVNGEVSIEGTCTAPNDIRSGKFAVLRRQYLKQCQWFIDEALTLEFDPRFTNTENKIRLSQSTTPSRITYSFCGEVSAAQSVLSNLFGGIGGSLTYCEDWLRVNKTWAALQLGAYVGGMIMVVTLIELIVYTFILRSVLMRNLLLVTSVSRQKRVERKERMII